MQTCAKCNATSPDLALECVHCHANLAQFSTNAVALAQYRQNPRISFIRISVAADACPFCYESRGTFDKNDVPILPHQGCSHPLGCRCTYAPVLDDIYP